MTTDSQPDLNRDRMLTRESCTPLRLDNDGAIATVEQGSLQQAQQLAIGIVSTFLASGRWHPTSASSTRSRSARRPLK